MQPKIISTLFSVLTFLVYENRYSNLIHEHLKPFPL